MQTTVTLVNLSKLKQSAQKLLKPDSKLLMILMSEPDTLPLDEYLIKVGIFDKLLVQELDQNA